MTDPVITIHVDTKELDDTIRKLGYALELQQQLRCIRWCPICALKRWWVRP